MFTESAMEVTFNNKRYIINTSDKICSTEIKLQLHQQTGVCTDSIYLVSNGKCIQDDQIIENGLVHANMRILGGKGGFGSMLRAIGAQIEKTTNREACRDLSGRRLRDINEEQRLKNWIAAQAEREKEAAERKQKKLERLCQQPKHEFRDENYDKERSALPEKVEDAVEQGFKAASSLGNGTKRKQDNSNKTIKKKKPKLWVDADVEDDLSSTDDENSEDEAGGNSSNSADSTNLFKGDDHKQSNASATQEASTSKQNIPQSVVSEETENNETQKDAIKEDESKEHDDKEKQSIMCKV